VAFKAILFDAYGTLFDVAAAARNYAQSTGARPEFARQWRAIAAMWRLKQLEYSWLRGLSGDYTDFWAVTRDALEFTLEKHDCASEILRDRLMELYDHLDAYSDVAPTLAALKAAQYKVGILSNGAPAMLASAVESAGIGDYLDVVLSVDSVKTFKPHGSVYGMATAAFRAQRREIVLISCNGWDICSASAYGLTSIWVNRHDDPLDRLAAKPDRIISDMSALCDAIERLEQLP
jgi:2-haloacid dehalogenase